MMSRISASSFLSLASRAEPLSFHSKLNINVLYWLYGDIVRWRDVHAGSASWQDYALRGLERPHPDTRPRSGAQHILESILRQMGFSF